MKSYYVEIWIKSKGQFYDDPASLILRRQKINIRILLWNDELTYFLGITTTKTFRRLNSWALLYVSYLRERGRRWQNEIGGGPTLMMCVTGIVCRRDGAQWQAIAGVADKVKSKAWISIYKYNLIQFNQIWNLSAGRWSGPWTPQTFWLLTAEQVSSALS